MSIYTIIDRESGETTWVDTDEEAPESELFTFCDERNGHLYWGEVALIQGAAESLVAGDVGMANLDLAALGLVVMTEAEAASLGDVNDKQTREFFAGRGIDASREP